MGHVATDPLAFLAARRTNPLPTEDILRGECVGVLGAACVVGSNRKRPMLLYELLEGVEATPENTNIVRQALNKANAKRI